MNLLAAIIDATIDQEAGRPPAEASDRGQPIPLDLHPALAVLGYYDGVYLVISELPPAPASRPAAATPTAPGHCCRTNWKI
jgi:hypothetical protein